MEAEARCPKCNGLDLIAITYAYHRIINDDNIGPRFEHFDWSERYALQCNMCGWTHGDPEKPLSNEPLARALAPELIELEEFEKELRERRHMVRERRHMDCGETVCLVGSPDCPRRHEPEH
jgi:hypothetical protein